jgi:hypothetical protein
MRIIILFILGNLLLFQTSMVRSQNLGGNDFWFTFPLNYSNGPKTPGQNQLVIVSGCNTKGKVEFPALGGAAIDFTVSPGVATIVNLSANNNNVSEIAQNNGVHITSDSLISVSAVNYSPFSVDGETLMPTSALGTSYEVMGYSTNAYYGPSEFTILATQDNTSVTITTAANTTAVQQAAYAGPVSHAAGSSWNVTLNKGQTYMVTAHSTTANTSLSRSRVNADKPIMVVSHSACTNFICNSCDMIMCQLLPMHLWGTKYVTAQAQQRIRTGANSIADYLEIVSGPSGANVTINTISGNTTIPLGPYQMTRYCAPRGAAPDPGEANTVITSDNPIQVSQYSQGAVCDGSTNTDPEHIIIYPESMWISDYTFSCSTTLTSVSQGITIYANGASGLDGFVLAGVPIPSTYKYRRIAVAPGPHHLTNINGIPFAFYQYAFGSAESYIVQGGASYDNCMLVTVPLESLILNATLENGTARLTWKPVSASDNSSYEIQRSTDLNNFSTVAILSSKPFTSSFYSHDDKDIPKNAVVYYRIKELASDGKHFYSSIVALDNVDRSRLEVRAAWYDPAQASLNLNIFSGNEQNIRIRISDLLNQEIYSFSPQINPGANTVRSNCGTLSPGVYVVTIMNEKDLGILQTSKFMVY